MKLYLRDFARLNYFTFTAGYAIFLCCGHNNQFTVVPTPTVKVFLPNAAKVK